MFIVITSCGENSSNAFEYSVVSLFSYPRELSNFKASLSDSTTYTIAQDWGPWMKELLSYKLEPLYRGPAALS